MRELGKKAAVFPATLSVAYFVLWGCMPVARGPALIPLANETHTHHSVEAGAGDLGPLSTSLYGGLQYSFLRPQRSGGNWAYGGRIIGNLVQLDEYLEVPTAGAGLIARRRLWDSELTALQVEVGALWASVSLPMSQPVGDSALLYWQPGLQLAPAHSYELLTLPLGAAFPLQKNFWLSMSAELSLESHLAWSLFDSGSSYPAEPGYGASLGLHWQAPKKLGRKASQKK